MELVEFLHNAKQITVWQSQCVNDKQIVVWCIVDISVERRLKVFRTQQLLHCPTPVNFWTKAWRSASYHEPGGSNLCSNLLLIGWHNTLTPAHYTATREVLHLLFYLNVQLRKWARERREESGERSISVWSSPGIQWQSSQAKHYRGQQASIRPTWTLNDFIYSFPRRVYYLFPRSRPTPPQGTAHNWVFVWVGSDTTAHRHNGHIKQIAVSWWVRQHQQDWSGRQELMWETFDTDLSNTNLYWPRQAGSEMSNLIYMRRGKQESSKLLILSR